MRRSRARRQGWAVASGGVLVGLVVLGLCAALVSTGVLWPNRIFAAAYPVHGVDVSSYQGRIDWDVLAGQHRIDFAFIKATEGSSDRDDRFTENWAAARKTDLVVGAYHFLSFDSPGETQAENIIRTVPAEAGTLPVAVDVELYGRYLGAPPSRDKVSKILDPLLAALKKHYGVAPILYATGDAYSRYLSGSYAGDPLWIRSIVAPPTVPDARRWTFWQYSDHDRRAGYAGEEQYIDLNVFAGTRQRLDTLLQHGGP